MFDAAVAGFAGGGGDALAASLASPPSARAASAGCAMVQDVAGVRGAVEALERGLGAASHMTVDERRQAIAGVDGLIGRLTSVRAGLLVAERDSGAWRAGGAASFAQARGSSSGAGQGAANREERQADALVGLSAVGDAARSGVIGLSHVDVIARVAADRSESVRNAVASPEGQAELVELAKTQDAPAFGRAVQRWAAGHDSEALESSHQAQRRARYLNLSATDSGTRVRGLLDAQSGHRLRLALEAVSPRPAADDDRSSEQRAADALVTLAEAALADPTTAPGAAVRPHVSYLIREHTFIALRGRRVATAGDGAGTSTETARTTADDSADPGVAALVLHEDGTPVPRSEAERALCDCEITRIVVDADDVPMNLGRTQRLYAGVHRRAVIARDRSCRWPGCSMPARWCEIHHIRWWDRDGGDTSVTNAVLLCAFHHHETHRRNLDVTRLEPPPRDARQGRRRRQGTRRTDLPADEPGSDAAARSAERQRPGPPERTSPRPDNDPDGGGGARYRFIDTTGRAVAGPPWNESASGPDASSAEARADTGPSDGTAGPRRWGRPSSSPSSAPGPRTLSSPDLAV